MPVFFRDRKPFFVPLTAFMALPLTALLVLPLTAFLFFLLASCGKNEVLSTQQNSSNGEPDFAPSHSELNIWPRVEAVFTDEVQLEAKVQDLLSRMTLEEKVGQIIQADIGSITPEEMKQFHLGSILNGGDSVPSGKQKPQAADWLALADEFWIASTDTSDGGVGIPALWATDAVHGHNNIAGATLFPHNIGLGAANDPTLMREIAKATAQQVRITGMDWTFAPSLAVAQDDRWGRTYESFSEHTDIVSRYAAAIIDGLQGEVNTSSFLDASRVLASAKHFVGDGGTQGGVDQGNTILSEAELSSKHGAGYPVAIARGVQTVMASYSSWNGQKLHGHKMLLNDVLVETMNFQGFVIGDWNGHGQVAGCTNIACAKAFNSGIDMLMAPDSWKGLYENTLLQIKSGEISEARLNQAVARILRVKFRAGLFEAGLPSLREGAGQFDQLSSPEIKKLAREAVRKSLVLLKNEDGLLPLSPALKVLVTGDAAHDIAKQCGGWTLSWQGTTEANDDFPNATSIYSGIQRAVDTAGGRATLSPDGRYDTKPDVAIVVFGEAPYAEYEGDLPDVDFRSEEALALLTRFENASIPTVAVFLSGRPMWVNPELAASNAFVAAWLPGTEGNGIADLLFKSADDQATYDFTGRLSFSWPNSKEQNPVNFGDAHYAPLFPYGFGLSYLPSPDSGVSRSH